MAAGLPDLVDCARLAADGDVVERIYAIAEMPRLQDVLAETGGMVAARFVFGNLPGGRAGASVAVTAEPKLVCQRCLQAFPWRLSAASEVEFASEDGDEGAGSSKADAPRESYLVKTGQVSLRDLAEEEVLLALPIVPACSTPRACGNAPGAWQAGEAEPAADGPRRPFGDLRKLLKKT